MLMFILIVNDVHFIQSFKKSGILSEYLKIRIMNFGFFKNMIIFL